MMGRFDYASGLVHNSAIIRIAADLEQQTNSLRAVGASDADIRLHHALLTACARMGTDTEPGPPNSWTLIEGTRAGVAIVAAGLPLIPDDPAEWVYQMRGHLYGAWTDRLALERTLGFQQWLAAARMVWVAQP